LPLPHYGWLVAAITFATGLVSSGIRAAPPVFIVPYEVDFGWSRAAISAAISVNLLLGGLASPISGRLIDTYGPRRFMIGSLSVLAVGVAGTLVMSDVWHLTVLWGLVVGMAGGAGSVLGATVAARWFVARRGLVVGLLGTMTPTAQLVFFPLVMALTVGLGWRTATLFLVALAAVMLVPQLLWMRDDPAQLGLAAYGKASGTEAARQQVDARRTPLPVALRTPEFWLLAGSFFVCGATSTGLIGIHLIPHSIDHGIAPVTAAAALGTLGVMNFVGTVASGWLTDRYDPRKLLALYYTFRGVSLLFLPLVADAFGLVIFAIVFGLDYVATVPATVAITARRFGRRSIGTIFGWIFCSHQVGSAVAASGAAAVRMAFGDYQLAFLAAATLCLVGASMVLFIRPVSVSDD
jgi:MFS family permease